jgi:hypothetical protein
LQQAVEEKRKFEEQQRNNRLKLQEEEINQNAFIFWHL